MKEFVMIGQTSIHATGNAILTPPDGVSYTLQTAKTNSIFLHELMPFVSCHLLEFATSVQLMCLLTEYTLDFLFPNGFC